MFLTQEFQPQTHMEALIAPQHTSLNSDSISHSGLQVQEAVLRNSLSPHRNLSPLTGALVHVHETQPPASSSACRAQRGFKCFCQRPRDNDGRARQRPVARVGGAERVEG